MPEAGGEAQRIDARPRGDGHVKTRFLPVRQIYAGKPLAEAGMHDIGRDADDRQPGFVLLVVQANAFPDRILAGPEPVGQALTEDRSFMSDVAVEFSELTSKKSPNSVRELERSIIPQYQKALSRNRPAPSAVS